MPRGSKFLLLACCVWPALGREEVTRDFQKTVTLAAGEVFRITHSLGNVSIHTHAGREAEIHASMKCSAGSAADARNWCGQIRIVVEETPDSVSVRTEYPPGSQFRGRNFGYSVNYDITLPDTAPLEVHNRFGTVSVADVHAAASVSNANGRVALSGGRGRQRIENSFGDVAVTRVDGDVTLTNTNGNVTAADVTGALDAGDHFGSLRATNIGGRVDIRAGNSTVAVTNAGGPATIANTFGAVTVTEIRGDVTVENQNGRVEATGIAGAADLRTSFEGVRFTRIGKNLTVHAQNSSVTGDTVGGAAAVETTFGAIELRGVTGGARAIAANSSIRLNQIGGEIYAKTSFGGVAVEDAAGPVTVEDQNGSVTVRGRASKNCQPMVLHTTFGPIRVAVSPGVGYDVTARTTFGRIVSQPAMQVSGATGGDSVAGKIAGGGCALKLNDQNGSVEIEN